MQVTIHCHPKLMAKISIYNQLNIRRRRDFFFPIDNYMFINWPSRPPLLFMSSLFNNNFTEKYRLQQD